MNTSRLPGRVSLGLLKKGVRVLKGRRRLTPSLSSLWRLKVNTYFIDE